MKKLKRILAITIAMSAIIGAQNTFAAQAGFGTDLTVKTVSGRVVDGSFEDYMTDGTDTLWKENTWPFSGTFFDNANGTNFDGSRRKEVACIKNECPRTGNNSIAVDFDILSSLSTLSTHQGRLIMQHNISYTKPSTYYFEAWVKLADESKAALLDESSGWSTPANIRMDDYGSDGSYSNAFGIFRSTDAVDENGWRKVSFTKQTVGARGGTISVGPGVFNYHATGEGLGKIYFDDIRIFELPASISADISKKVYDFDDAVDLSNIKIYGTDSAGNKSEFANYGSIAYEIESGEGEIRDGKLYYNGTGDGEVTVKASFLTLQTNITLYFGSPIKINSIQKEQDGSYKISACSVTGDTYTATVIAAVFDGDNVTRKIITATSPIAATDTTVITPVVDVSGIPSPTVKIFVWDSLSGMSPQADVNVK